MKKLGEGTPSFVLPKDDELSLFRAIEVLRNRVVGAINQIIGGRTVSESEWDTGKTWVDGRAIYAKALDMGLVEPPTAKVVAHGISTQEYFISLSGMGNEDGGTDSAPLPNTVITLAIDTTNVTIDPSSGSLTDFNAWVIIEFVKS